MIKEILKTAGIVILTLLLVLSLIISLSAKTASKSLEYSNLKPAFQETVAKVLLNSFKQNPEQKPDDMYNSALVECKKKNSIEMPTSNLGLEENITLACEEIKDAGSIDKVINIAAGKIFDKNYYKKYDCNFFTCSGNSKLLFLISHSSKQLFSKLFLIFLFIFVGLLILEFFIFSKKKNFFVLNGVLWISISLPLIAILTIIKNNNSSFGYVSTDFVFGVIGGLRFDSLIIGAVSLIFLVPGIILNFRIKQDL